MVEAGSGGQIQHVNVQNVPELEAVWIFLVKTLHLFPPSQTDRILFWSKDIVFIQYIVY